MVHDKVVTKAIGSLSYDFQLMQCSIEHHGVVDEGVFVGPLDIVLNLGDGIQDVQESYRVGYLSIHRGGLYLHQYRA